MLVRLLWSVVLIATCCFSLCGKATAEDRTLFDFTRPDSLTQWQIVNDGVMGGRSSSQIKLVETDTKTKVMRFTGKLSLANNGGFASVRSRPQGSLGLKPDSSIVLRVKGDGRKYTFNLYTPDRRTAFSYQLEFETKKGEWLEVKLPISKFVAHSYGRPLPNLKLDANRVTAVGILLGDKKEGDFTLRVDWIKVG